MNNRSGSKSYWQSSTAHVFWLSNGELAWGQRQIVHKQFAFEIQPHVQRRVAAIDGHKQNRHIFSCACTWRERNACISKSTELRMHFSTTIWLSRWIIAEITIIKYIFPFYIWLNVNESLCLDVCDCITFGWLGLGFGYYKMQRVTNAVVYAHTWKHFQCAALFKEIDIQKCFEHLFVCVCVCVWRRSK